MRRYNKGEWSELYAICLVLNQKIIKVADNDLEATEQYIKVLQLFMLSIEGEASYDLTKENIAIIVNDKVIKSLSLDSSEIQKLLADITAGSGVFSLPFGDKMMGKLLLDAFKTKSSQKSDLDTVSIMPNEETSRKIGFSIKSQIGSPATLVNGAKTTNIIYEVTGFDGDIAEVNNLPNPAKYMKRVRAIKEGGGVFHYHDNSSQVFKQNMRLTDILMPEILAHMTLSYFTTSGLSHSKDLVRDVVKQLPFSTTELEIATKVKDFYANMALGMKPSEEWDGTMLNGGAIFVKSDGELVCYTLYDMDQFKDYLFNNTKFDTASSRNEFGELYIGGDNKLYFSLNLDVRFLH